MKDKFEKTPYAKDLELPRGTMAEVARRLGIPYSTALQRWEYEKPEVVEAVVQVVKEYRAAESAVKNDLQEIQQLTQ